MIDPTRDPTECDTNDACASVNPDDASLTAQEEAILRALRSAPHRVLSRNELARAAGLHSSQGRRVDVLLVRIRRTLGDESIVNIRNRGWRLVSGAVDAVEPALDDVLPHRRVSA